MYDYLIARGFHHSQNVLWLKLEPPGLRELSLVRVLRRGKQWIDFLKENLTVIIIPKDPLHQTLVLVRFQRAFSMGLQSSILAATKAG